jgi:hypothetical protein
VARVINKSINTTSTVMNNDIEMPKPLYEYVSKVALNMISTVRNTMPYITNDFRYISNGSFT